MELPSKKGFDCPKETEQKGCKFLTKAKTKCKMCCYGFGLVWVACTERLGGWLAAMAADISPLSNSTGKRIARAPAGYRRLNTGCFAPSDWSGR